MLTADSLENVDPTKDKTQKLAGSQQLATKLFETGKVIGNGQKLVTSSKAPVAQTRTQRLQNRNLTKNLANSGIEPSSTNKALMEITTSDIDE